MRIPVTRNFDTLDLIGQLILSDGVEIPPDHVFSMSYFVREKDGMGKPNKIALQSISLIPDSNFSAYLRKDQPTIVCLCGSTRFSEAFHEANLRETLAGNIVLSIGCDFKSDTDLLLAGELTHEDKERLDELHLRKIDLADEVLFLNVNGYMGESTRREHQYATNHGKIIRYLVEPD